MKSILLLSLLLAISCGVEEPVPSDLNTRLGQSIEIDENDTYSAEEVAAIQKICASLDQKVFFFENAQRVNKVVEYKFELYTKDCGEKKYSKAKKLTAVVAENTGTFRYSGNSEERDFNSEVLVSDSKVLNEVCENLSIETKRFELAGDYGVWIEALDNRSGVCAKRMENEAQPDNDVSHCFVLTTAKINESSGKYKIESVELLELITASSDIRGTVYKRKSTLKCTDDEESQTKIQLNKY